MKRLLSLFDYTGNWSMPYRNAGVDVLQIDKELGQDILTWNYKQFSQNHFGGILAAVPCTAYALCVATYWPKKDADGTTEYYNSLTRKTLEIVDYFRPGLKFWCIENPVGRIAKCVPELKKFRLYAFHPYQFGDAYSKYTILYGEFSPWLIHNPVKPIYSGKHHSVDFFYMRTDDLKIDWRKRAFYRSQTPHGFAKAFYMANIL